MAIVGREVSVIRYFKVKQDGRGEPIHGTEDEDIWIDVEVLTAFVTEHGSGINFKRRLWTLDWEATSRTIQWKKIYKDEDNDPEAWALAGIITKAFFESGTGQDYRRFSQQYDNSPQNISRSAETYRIYHAEFKNPAQESGDVDVDQDDFIDVEVIRTFILEFGTGITFHREIWSPANEDIPIWKDLPQTQYRVREKPGEFGRDNAYDGRPNPEKIWPSKREFIQKGNLGEIK